MKTSRSNKGFTLVEIMIVVVIIGLLAAMAIPAFQKVRQNSINGTLKNDARQISAAAQQYMLENSVTTVTVQFDPTTGLLQTTPLSTYVTRVGKGITPSAFALSINVSYSLSNPQGGSTLSFSPEGQPL